MRRFPQRLLEVIRERKPRPSTHAVENMERLGSEWEDIVSVAKTADSWKKERDERVPGDFKYEMTGRDTCGRRMYSAGKETRIDGEAVRYVITFHEAG